MTQTINHRRLEMIGDRIEACLAGQRIRGEVIHIRTQDEGFVAMVVSTSPSYDLRKLQDEISLSLGLLVRQLTVYSGAVICEVLP